MDSKLTYEAPSCEKVGTFEALTQAGTSGRRFDGNFNAGGTVPTVGGLPSIFS